MDDCRYGSPLPMTRMAWMSSSGLTCFRTYPSAPASNADAISSSTLIPVRIRTLISGNACLIIRVAALPPSPGIFKSISTRSGTSPLVISTASAPVLASPAISKSFSRLRTICKPRRTMAWSSASRIRILSCLDEGWDIVSKLHLNPRALAWLTFDTRLGANRARPFTDAG